MVSPYHPAGNARFPIEYLLHLLQGLLTSRRTPLPVTAAAQPDTAWQATMEA